MTEWRLPVVTSACPGASPEQQMNPTYSLPVSERLRAIVARAFPDRPDVATVPLATSLRDTWRHLARAAGVDAHGLASGIARELGLGVAEDLDSTDPFATRLVPERLASRLLVLPMRERDGTQGITCLKGIAVTAASASWGACG